MTQDGGRIFLEHQHEPPDHDVKVAFEINCADIPCAKYYVRPAESSSPLLGDLQCLSINVKPDDGAFVANYLANKQGDVPDAAADIKYVHTTANASCEQHPHGERTHYFGLLGQPFILANSAA
jgi:hypothetical protein